MRRGFSLVELSVVLVIIAIVIGGGMATFSAYVQKSQVDLTVSRMDAIENALLNYSAAFGRIPCPASLTLTSTSSNYGVESANQGSCVGGSPAANYTATGGFVEGAVPVKALQLPDTYMYDGWGNRFTFGVDPDFTNSNTLPISIGGACSASTKAISIQDANSNTLSSSGVYAIISHGQNGHGAYTANGVVSSNGSVNAAELVNCHCNSSGTKGTLANYVQNVPLIDTGNNLDNFDDIVTYKEPWQLQKNNASNLIPDCIYMVDNLNNLIYKYSSKSRVWTTLSNAAFSSPRGIAADSNGNIFLASGNTILKYTNSTGTWANFVTGLSTPQGIFLSKSGILLVANSGANNVKSYNAAGTLLTTYTQGFSTPSDVGLDANNNVWITDQGNNRILKSNYAGTSWTIYGSAGTAPGQFNYPTSIYADYTGNIWVVDSYNNRVQKYDGTNWTVWGGTAAGSSNGSFNSPIAIRGDDLSNIWITDYGNFRIQKFSNNIWTTFYNANSTLPRYNGIITAR